MPTEKLQLQPDLPMSVLVAMEAVVVVEILIAVVVHQVAWATLMLQVLVLFFPLYFLYSYFFFQVVVAGIQVAVVEPQTTSMAEEEAEV